MVLFKNKKVRLQIQGIMPERALLRLRRAEIPLYDIQKTQSTCITFSVKSKDEEKVFAIYPKAELSAGLYTSYTVTKLPAAGVDKVLQTLKKRWGIIVGIGVFCCVTLYADSFVFGVEIVGSKVYAREIYAALEEADIRPFAKYSTAKQDEFCAKMLALDGVEFCSVQKAGLWARVEMRLGGFAERKPQTDKMQSKYTGEVVAITALRGTPMKKIGDKVVAGEILVSDDVVVENGGQIRVEVIARVQIACTYEAVICADDAESAFAAAYLEIGGDSVELTGKSVVEERENTYAVRLLYTATQTMNL